MLSSAACLGGTARKRRQRRTAPTREELEAAEGKRVPDVLGPGLSILYCGINPGLRSAAAGHHFAGPGNRFWPALHAAGLTPRRLEPAEDAELLRWGQGITNLVARATATAGELAAEELERGGRELERKVVRWRPAVVAFLGIGAYRLAFGRPRAAVGRAGERIARSEVWVLPNPSGLNARYRREEIVALLRLVRRAAARPRPGRARGAGARR